MAVSHVKSNTVPDFTGTVTVFNSQGSTATIAATDIVRPSDWNSVHNQYYTLTGNTTGGSTASGTNVVWAASGQASIGASGGNTLYVSVPVEASASAYAPPWAHSGRATNSSLGQNTIYFMPFDVYDYVAGSRINFYISLSGALSAGNSTGTCYVVASYGLYTRNSDSLSLATSYGATVVSQSMNSNTQYAATHYIGLSDVTSHSTSQFAGSATNISTYQATSVNGQRVLALPLNSTLTPGRYYLAFANSTITGNAMTNNVSFQHTTVGVQPAIVPFGVNSVATNASVFRAPVIQGFGSYSATSGAFPNTVAFTTDHIRHGVALTQIHFDILGYSTNTNVI